MAQIAFGKAGYPQRRETLGKTQCLVFVPRSADEQQQPCAAVSSEPALLWSGCSPPCWWGISAAITTVPVCKCIQTGLVLCGSSELVLRFYLCSVVWFCSQCSLTISLLSLKWKLLLVFSLKFLLLFMSYGTAASLLCGYVIFQTDKNSEKKAGKFNGVSGGQS